MGDNSLKNILKNQIEHLISRLLRREEKIQNEKIFTTGTVQQSVMKRSKQRFKTKNDYFLEHENPKNL